MDITENCSLAGALSREMRRERDDLTRRWLERIAARVSVEPNRIFPSEDLLDHVPVLMDGIADYLEDPAAEISADVPVIAKAIELGDLRHGQGFSAQEILKEYEILGGVLFAFLVRTVDGIDEPCTRGELLACAHRLFRAVSIIQQVTTAQYLRLADERVNAQQQALRSFNRMVSHELKNRIGAVVGAGQMLQEEWVRNDRDQLVKFASIAVANALSMEQVLQDLLSLSQVETDARRQRHVRLPEAVAEVVRQLREMAADRGVSVRVADDLPEVEVNASAVELCLINYVSNAIKYSDPDAAERWVEIRSTVEEGPSGRPDLVIWVRDNGIGVPEDERSHLFRRLFRVESSAHQGVEGTGLGLSIVRETVEALGGRAWAEFDGARGSVFKLALPLRREEDPSG